MGKAHLYNVYILTTARNTVLYTGVTNDLARRLEEHRTNKKYGFTSKYNVTKLVYFETFKYINDAILREKQIKGYRRSKKIALIESMNPDWKELSADDAFQ